MDCPIRGGMVLELKRSSSSFACLAEIVAIGRHVGKSMELASLKEGDRIQSSL